jgi:hypothetical protein
MGHPRCQALRRGVEWIQMKKIRHGDPGREVISYLYSTRLFDPIIGP